MSEPISIEKLSASLQDRKDQLKRILAKDLEAVKNQISPWQEEMRGYIENAPYRDFGTYLRRVLKTPINTKQMIAEGSGNSPLVVGRNFYYKNYGRKRVFPSEKMFYAFNRKFADLITTGHKRELVFDFVRFKLAMCKYLEPFTTPQLFPISLPLDTVSVGCVGISDGMLSQGGRAKVYNYLAGHEVVKPKFMTIFFTEFPEFHNQTIEQTTRNFDNRTNRDYSAVISLFGEENADAYTLLGSTVVSLDKLTMDDSRQRLRLSALNAGELQYDILKGGRRSRPVKVDLDWITNEQTQLAFSNDDIMASGSVIGIPTEPKLKKLIPRTHLEHNKINQAKTIITNWSEVIALPEVQETINKYVSTWNLITRSWNFMKQKYAYKVLLHGHF